MNLRIFYVYHTSLLIYYFVYFNKLLKTLYKRFPQPTSISHGLIVRVLTLKLTNVGFYCFNCTWNGNKWCISIWVSSSYYSKIWQVFEDISSKFFLQVWSLPELYLNVCLQPKECSIQIRIQQSHGPTILCN